MRFLKVASALYPVIKIRDQEVIGGDTNQSSFGKTQANQGNKKMVSLIIVKLPCPQNGIPSEANR